MQAKPVTNSKNPLKMKDGKKPIGRQSLKMAGESNTSSGTSQSKEFRRKTVTVSSDSSRNKQEKGSRLMKQKDDASEKMLPSQQFSFKEEGEDHEKVSGPELTTNLSSDKLPGNEDFQEPVVHSWTEVIESNRRMASYREEISQQAEIEPSNLEDGMKKRPNDRKSSGANSARSSVSNLEKTSNIIQNESKNETSYHNISAQLDLQAVRKDPLLHEANLKLDSHRSQSSGNLHSSRSNQGSYLTEKLTKITKPSHKFERYMELRQKYHKPSNLEITQQDKEPKKDTVQKNSTDSPSKNNDINPELILNIRATEELKRVTLSTITSSLVLFNNVIKPQGRRDMEVLNSSRSYREDTKINKSSSMIAQRRSHEDISKSMDISRSNISKPKTARELIRPKSTDRIISPQKAKHMANRSQEITSSTTPRDHKPDHSVNDFFNSKTQSASARSKQSQCKKGITKEEFELHYRKMAEYEQKKQEKVESLRREKDQKEKSIPKTKKIINTTPPPMKVDNQQAFHQRIEAYMKRKDQKLAELRSKAAEERIMKETSGLTLTPKINKNYRPKSTAKTNQPIIHLTPEKVAQIESIISVLEKNKAQGQVGEQKDGPNTVVHSEKKSNMVAKIEPKAEFKEKAREEKNKKEHSEQNATQVIVTKAIVSPPIQKVDPKVQHDAFMNSVLSRISMSESKSFISTKSAEVETTTQPKFSLIIPQPVVNDGADMKPLDNSTGRIDSYPIHDGRINLNLSNRSYSQKITAKEMNFDSRPETAREFSDVPMPSERQVLTARKIENAERTNLTKKTSTSRANSKKNSTSPMSRSQLLSVKSILDSRMLKESPPNQSHISESSSSKNQTAGQDRMARFYHYLTNKQSSEIQSNPKDPMESIQKSENYSYNRSSLLIRENGDVSFEKPQRDSMLAESQNYSFTERPPVEVKGKKALAERLIQEFLKEQANTAMQTEEKQRKTSQKTTTWR